MDVRLSTEQQALRDAAAHAVGRLAPQAVGQLDDAERHARLDAAVVESGWRELRVAADLRRLAGVTWAEVTETVALSPGLGSIARAVGGSLPERSVAIDADGSTTALALTDDGRVATVALAGAASTLDLTRPTATPATSVVAIEGGRPLDEADLTRWSALGVALTCADLVGVMQGAIDLAVEYANGRNQFGTTIGSFQAIQHLLAEALFQLEGSRSAALHAAWAVDALEADDALAAAALAKAYSARSARTVCETVIQVHGGIGHTWECSAHVFLRRALVSTDLFGGVGPSLERVLVHNGIGGSDGLR